MRARRAISCVEADNPTDLLEGGNGEYIGDFKRAEQELKQTDTLIHVERNVKLVNGANFVTRKSFTCAKASREQ